MSTRNAGYFKGRKITVIGLARSGVSCANLLRALRADVGVSDARDTPAVRAFAGALSPGIRVETGGHSESFLSGIDLAVVSPGVPFNAPPLKALRSRNVPVLSEIEIGWMLSPAPVIAVTGSNGKTTVTTLIGRILEASGRRPVVCGNIGNPFTGEIERIVPDDTVVLEVSSFQLETIRDFRPAVAVILNFNRNHLDRHADMEEYLAAKKRIFMNQGPADHLVLNGSDHVLRQAGAQARSRVVYFGGKPGYDDNQSAVLSVASVLGIEASVCNQVFSSFSGLEHRMERVAEIEGVCFINDSKATTVESCVWALNSLPKPVVLICGGKDKGVDYSLAAGACREKVKETVLIGQAAEKIAAALTGTVPVAFCGTLEEAVRRGFRSAGRGGTVLLSPMCASFDMFENYEHRGKVFKQAVSGLEEEVKGARE